MVGASLRLVLASLAVAPLITGTAAAQDCSTAATQVEMNDCAGQAYHAADEALNAEYKRARAALDENARTALRDAQRAWIDFRDKACEVEGAQYAGGSIQPMVVTECLTRLTNRRTVDLQLLSQTN